MNCPKCNRVIENDSSFCQLCGSKISKESSVPSVVVTLGRAVDNTIQFANTGVSKHHASLTCSNGIWHIADLGSANGTYVNGTRITEADITPADILKLGKNVVVLWEDVLKHSQTPAVLQEKEKGKSYSGKSVITLGRQADNDIVISNVKASRHHARLTKEGDTWHIEDLESVNGTYVNGAKVKRSPISLTDTLTIAGIPVNLSGLFEEKTEFLNTVDLSVKNLTFRVGDRTIVDDVSFTIYPGEFVGLIGPSGAGKTTLMMMMNGNSRPSGGAVYINNQSLFGNINQFKGTIGFVPQDDIIHRELQVDESLFYTAKLRLGPGSTDSVIQEQVSAVVQTLDLREAQETLIGSPEKKGISGGQRKRVNMGQELLTEPNILFLDEPTSGLDPKTDMDVMKLLKNIADKGKLVILTTHNITADNFEVLTHLIVLTKGGKLAYFGPAREACSYFGVQKPFEIFDRLESEPADSWKQKYRESAYHQMFVQGRDTLNTARNSAPVSEVRLKRQGGIHQFFTLASRYLKIKKRDLVGTLILLAQAPIIALLIGFIFTGNKAAANADITKMNDMNGAVFMLVISAIWLGCSNAAKEIVSEQSIYRRERNINLRIPSYILSKVLILGVLCILQCVILAGVVHPWMELKISFPSLFGIMLITSLSALMIGLALSSFVKTTEAAMGLVPVILIPQVILAGMVKPFGELNGLKQALAAFTLSRWSYEASLSLNDKVTADNLGFKSGNTTLDVAVLAGYFLVFFLLTAYSLKRRDI